MKEDPSGRASAVANTEDRGLAQLTEVGAGAPGASPFFRYSMIIFLKGTKPPYAGAFQYHSIKARCVSRPIHYSRAGFGVTTADPVFVV
jgi:hypothetical protein